VGLGLVTKEKQMAGVPIYMFGDQITLVRTENGFAITDNKNDPAETAVVFETWDACAYYLGANFAPTPP
jgi:hypothetical protein